MTRINLSFGVGFKGTIDKLHGIELLTNDKRSTSAKSDLIMNGLQCVSARNSREHFENAKLTYQYKMIGHRLKSTPQSVLDNDSHFNFFLNLSNDTQLEVSSGIPVDGSYSHWCGIALIPRMQMTEQTRTRRAFVATELDEQQRQRNSSPCFPPARIMSLLLLPASIAPFWSLQTLSLRQTFLF